jgi:Domain of unknown function (DUF1648)
MTDRSPDSTALFRTVAALQWVALPVMALMFASVWQQLPARMTTHFDLANQPNGWMSRGQTLVVVLALATAVLIVATWIASRITEPDLVAWAVVGLFYVILVTLIWAEQAMIDYNLYGKPVRLGSIIMVAIVSALFLVVLSLSTRRGSQLPRARVFATETHASAFWAVMTGAPVVFVIAIASVAPSPAIKLALALATLLGLGAAAMAAFGFQYIFSSAGVDIRTLGCRLRSIAASDIRSYAVGDWGFWGGRGIRGVGNRRAYVWGNSGVRITTNAGEVFLGHHDPEKIVRDLDRVVQAYRASEDARKS